MSAVHQARVIARYFAGEIGEATERDALFAHLAGCDVCQAAFEAESAAHRALSGRVFGAVELGAMMPSLVEGAQPARSARKPWAVWGLLLSGAAAGLGVLLLTAPALLERDDPMTPKGGAQVVGPLVEVLCFDEAPQVVERLRESGSCPTPARLKVVFARTAPVPMLTVVVLGPDGAVRLSEVVRAPQPLAVLPGSVALKAGEVVQVIAIEGEEAIPLDVAKAAVPVMTLRGAP